MISKGPHLRDQPAEEKTSLTNELLNISPSLSFLLLLLLLFFHPDVLFIFEFFCNHLCTCFSVPYLLCQVVSLKSTYSCKASCIVYALFDLFFSWSVFLLCDVCCSGPLKQCGLIFGYTVSQRQPPVQTHSSAYT